MKESDDLDVIEVIMVVLGIVLKRFVGFNGLFREYVELFIDFVSGSLKKIGRC